MWAHFHGNNPRRSATIWQWSPKSFAIDFFELRRVEASPWTMSFLSMFTFIFRWKNVRFYCAFCHNKALKIFRQDFEINKNMDDSIFQNFAEVRDPILTSFLMIGCLSKWFSKHIEELTDSSRGLAQKIREIFAKNLWKNPEKFTNVNFLRIFCEFFTNFSRIFRKFFATDHVKIP